VQMRLLTLIAVCAAALALPAHAAEVDPQRLVLQEDDVPKGYQLDEDNTLALPNSVLRRARPEMRSIIARSGRVNGQATRYTNYGPPHWRYIVSWVDVFRTPQGAKLYYDWYLQLLRREGSGSFRPAKPPVGDAGVEQSGGRKTAIVWREGRAVAILSCQLMNGHRKLAHALARSQQRRIAAALG
jgi:hypothetical protein